MASLLRHLNMLLIRKLRHLHHLIVLIAQIVMPRTNLVKRVVVDRLIDLNPKKVTSATSVDHN